MNCEDILMNCDDISLDIEDILMNDDDMFIKKLDTSLNRGGVDVQSQNVRKLRFVIKKLEK